MLSLGPCISRVARPRSPGFGSQTSVYGLKRDQPATVDPAVEPVRAVKIADTYDQHQVPASGVSTEHQGVGGAIDLAGVAQTPAVEDAQLPARGDRDLRYRHVLGVGAADLLRADGPAFQHEGGDRGAVGADQGLRDVGEQRGLAEQQTSSAHLAAAGCQVNLPYLRDASRRNGLTVKS